MTAPSTFHNSPHDGRVDLDLPDGVEAADVVTVTPPERTTFIAGYRGAQRCASCREKVNPGDEVQYGLDDQLEHVDCIDPLVIPKQGVCDGCFLVLPVSGVCGVC